jgi:putative transposase
MTKEINEKLIEELLKGYEKPEDIIGKNGLLKQLTKAVLEKALEGEMTHHLGYEKHDSKGWGSGNSRNGKYSKTIKGDFGEMPVSIPRDRRSKFEPVIIPKGERHFKGFDDKIISMYARGMTTREIQGHLEEIYGVEVSPEFISTVTSSVLEEVNAWQNRSLEEIYPIVYLDALMVKVRDEGHILNKAVYLVIGINLEGKKEVLGIWIEQTEGAKFWLKVISELKTRGVKDIYIACVDGLKGFPEAIESVFPHTQIQACIVHMVRNSMKYVSYKNRKEIARDLKAIYQSTTEGEAENHLSELEHKWDGRYPMIGKSWRANWQRIIPMFSYPEEIRKMIYTTNAIESLNMTLRKVTKNRGSFPNDEAVIKLFYLALRNISKKWSVQIKNWGLIINQFVIIFKDRVKI